MKKTVNTNIQNARQFFEEAKQFMRLKNTQKIHWTKLKQYNHHSQQQTLSRLVGYLQSKIRIDKSTSDKQCQKNLNTVFQRQRVNPEKYNFKIDQEGITYLSKYRNVKDRESLLKQIQRYPEGILVDDQLIKFTVIKIKDYILQLINARKIIPVRSRLIQKSKMKDDNYEGYILFPFPSCHQKNLQKIFKNQSLQSEKNQKDKDREKKMQRIFGTVTSAFKKDFQNVCSSNINKGQNKSGFRENQQNNQSRYNTWDQINKKSIPNFQQLAEEWFKNRK